MVLNFFKMIPLMSLKEKNTSYKVFLLKLMNERANLNCFFVRNSLVNSRLCRSNALVLIRCKVQGSHPCITPCMLKL